MIDNDFSAIMTDHLEEMITQADNILEAVGPQLDQLKQRDPTCFKIIVNQHQEVSTWLCQAKCELFERALRLRGIT